MNHLASPPYTHDNSSLASSCSGIHYIDPAMRSLLASTWQVLEQPPPPSLRDVLGAYKSKGDGDRDMLLAMLQAKSAEDQRIASVASLHRAMLEMHHTPPPPHLPQLNMPNGGGRHYPFPSPAPPMTYSPPQTRESPSFSPGITLPSIRNHTSADGPRKRARVSASPPAQPHRADSQSTVASTRDLPPSPYSSTSGRSVSADSSHSPSQQQKTMAIGSLLSSNGPAKDGDDTCSAQTSPGRSSSRVVHDHSARGHARAPVTV